VSRVLRYEPALKYGLIVGAVAFGLRQLGVELSEGQRGALDGLIAAFLLLLPVLQALAQTLLTRGKVTPTAKLHDQGLKVPGEFPFRPLDPRSF
jgi:hypothetical protein